MRRSAKLGSIVGVQGARYAGHQGDQRRPLRGGRQGEARAAPPGDGDEDGRRARPDEGRGDEARPVRLLHRHRIPAPEYAEIYQEQLAKLRTDAPPMPWEKVVKVLEEEYEGEPLSELFAEFEQEAFAAASIGQVHRAELLDGRRVAVKIQYPGIAEALDADLRNMGTIVRLARALAPGLDAKAIAERAPRAGDGGARLRVRGAEPAQLRPRLPRPPVHLRAGSDHAALAAPGAGHRAGRGDRLRGDQGAARTRSAAASARSSSAAASARSTTCSTSTPTPTPATTS